MASRIPRFVSKTSDEAATANSNLLLLGLVIDNIVYDCSSFVDKHPGGDAVVRSFAGKDCSCKRPLNPTILLATPDDHAPTGQFHKIHNMQKTRNWLPHLKVGRTEGIANPFPEPSTGARKRVGIHAL